MTVKISKPALNLREELNKLDKPSGITGETLLRADTDADARATLGIDNFEQVSVSTDGVISADGLTSSGNLLVGKSGVNFNADGTEIKPGGELYVTQTNAHPLQLNRLSSDGDIAKFYKDGTTVGSIGTKTGDLAIGTGDTGVRFVDGDDALMPHSVTANDYRGNAINLGTSNYRFKDLYLSGTANVGALKTSASIQSSTNLTFWVPNVGEAARIEANTGNLLVGKTSPTISTTGVELRPNGQVFATQSGNYPLLLNRTTSDGDIAQFRKDGTTVGSIGANSGRIYIGSGNSGLRFDYSAGNAVVPSDQSGNLYNGGVNLGATAAKFQDLYLSGGVYLGGTGAANKLDDYEEGTWTPTDGSGAGLTFTNTVGTYTKIGRQVFLVCEVQYPTTSDASDMDISGLPFSATDTFRFAGVMSYTTSSSAGSSQIINRTTSSIVFRENGTSTVQHNNELSGKVFRFTMVYHTTA